MLHRRRLMARLCLFLGALILLATPLLLPITRSAAQDNLAVYLPEIFNSYDPRSTEPIAIPPPPVSDTAVSGLWSNPDTWGGAVPGAGAVVQIPAGVTVQLDTATASLGGLYIDGTLTAVGDNVAITSAHIMVHGTLEIGTAAAPYAGNAVITLTGAATNTSIMGMGSKFLGTMGMGVISLHGTSSQKLSWAKLAATVAPGATSLTLIEAPGWQVGDEIVIAPTGLDPNQAEKVTVTAVDGTTISFAPALQYEHWGELQTFAGRTLDQRAAVGLLSRNIVITSAGVDPQSSVSSDRFGGHVMIMAGGKAFIEGVEFRQMGQERRLGRYAFHWHLAGDVSGQYVRNSSVNTTFTRGFVVHGSTGALIENNVGYESHSHMFVFAEDGSEVNNTFRGNLGVLVRFLPEERRIFEDDEADSRDRGARKQDEHRPSTFWGLNIYNTLEGNVAAGSESGSGYFYGRGAKGAYGTFVFRDNIAHSHFGPTGGNDRYPPLTRGYGLFITEIHPNEQPPIVFENFTAFKNSLAGIWIDDNDHTVRGAMLSDNTSGIIISRSIVEDSVIVGRTANTNGEHGRMHDGFTSVGISTATRQGGEKGPIVRNVSFINLSDAAFGMRNDSLLPSSNFSNVTLIDTPNRISFGTTNMSGAVRDEDGSLTGADGPRVVIGNRSLQAGSGCVLREDWNAYLCPESNRLVNISVDLLDDNRAEVWEPITVTRDDSVSGIIGVREDARRGMVLAGRTYRLSFANGFTRGSYMLSTSDDDDLALTVGEWAVVGVPLAGNTVYAYLDNPDSRGDQPDPTRQLTAVADLAALAAGDGKQFFFDQAAGMVYVKLIGSAEQPKIFVCNSAGC